MNAAALIAAAAALICACPARAASVTKAELGDLGLGARVVTDVDLSGLDVPEPGYSAFTNTAGGVMHGPLKLAGAGSEYAEITTNGVRGMAWKKTGFFTSQLIPFEFRWYDLMTEDEVPAWARGQNKPAYTAEEVGALPSNTTHLAGDVPVTRKINGMPLTSDIEITTGLGKEDADALYFPLDVGNAWQTYWDGDDVRLTVTNYYGSAGMPSLYLEEKRPADGDHASPWFQVVWDERTRWTEFLAGYAAITNKVEHDKADRAWGVYDSSLGTYSPDGVLQISQERVQIAAGLAYQKTVNTGGCAVWVLRSTLPAIFSGKPADGYFRIEDGDGSVLFEIVKGNKRTVGANASALSTSEGAMTVTYNVDSAEHPILEVCTSLSDPDWQQEGACHYANISWRGGPGAWVVDVLPTAPYASMFVKASYETGGETYINNAVPVGLGSVFVDGKSYRVKVVEINGRKVLGLE